MVSNIILMGVYPETAFAVVTPPSAGYIRAGRPEGKGTDVTVAPLVTLSRVKLLVAWSGFVSVVSEDELVEDSEEKRRLLWVRKDRSEGMDVVVVRVAEGVIVDRSEVMDDVLSVVLSLALPLGKVTLSEVVAVAMLDVSF